MTCVTSHLTVLMKKRSFMEMYFHKHCDGQNHQGSLIMEDVSNYGRQHLYQLPMDSVYECGVVAISSWLTEFVQVRADSL